MVTLADNSVALIARRCIASVSSTSGAGYFHLLDLGLNLTRWLLGAVALGLRVSRRRRCEIENVGENSWIWPLAGAVLGGADG